MSLTRNTKNTIAVAVILALGACSSGSDDTVTDAAGTDQPMTDTAGTDTTGTDTTTDTTTDTSSQTPTALFGPAQYLLSECGSVAVSDAAATNSLTAPTQMTVGVPVRGQLVPNSVDTNAHRWQVTLEPGNYHFIADGSTLKEDGIDAVGLKFESLGATTADNKTLAQYSEAAYDIRMYEYLEIQATQTLTIRVEASFNTIHNYAFGIFRNGSAVPSPTIERCLPISSLSVDSPQSLGLKANNTREDTQWYKIDLESRQYQLDASIRVAELAAIGYKFDLLSQFGQSSDSVTISQDSVAGTELITSNKFETVSGTYWIKLNNAFRGETTTVDFTVSAP